MDEKKWFELRQDEAYLLSMAEFKGATLQALKELREDVNENRKSIKRVDEQVSNLKVISATIGALGGVATSIFSLIFQQR